MSAPEVRVGDVGLDQNHEADNPMSWSTQHFVSVLLKTRKIDEQVHGQHVSVEVHGFDFPLFDRICNPA